MRIFVLLVIYVSFLQIVNAQVSNTKPLRVDDVEEKIEEDASSYFFRRYPGMAFSVNAQVDPLRTKISGSEIQESLPYFDFGPEAEFDVWEDPSMPISQLRNKVVRINVNISLPSDFDEAKVDGIKQDLFIYLRLTPARDDIRIDRKLSAINSSAIPNHYFYIIASLLLSSIILGGMIKWSAGTVKTTGGTVGAEASQGTPVVSQSSGSSYTTERRSANKRSADPISLNEVTVNDSLKLWEIASGRIKTILESNTFPTFPDMLVLDGLAEKHPSKLGAILFEMPLETQKKVMRFGKGEKWLEAYSNPGKLDNDCLDVLEKMSRLRKLKSDTPEMEVLLIQIWRMEKLAETFIKLIPQDHSFAILDSLPKSISLPLARRVFPGGWGKLLDRKQIVLLTDHSFVVSYTEKTKEIMPFYDDLLVDQYSKDREILTYLDSVNIQDEKEIYEVLDEHSFVKKIRKPFYPIFNLSPEKFTGLVFNFPIEAWAYVTINSPRSYAKMVADSLDDKKKILFSSFLKGLDASPPAVADVVDWRQQILSAAYSNYPDDFLISINIPTADYEEGRESA